MISGVTMKSKKRKLRRRMLGVPRLVGSEGDEAMAKAEAAKGRPRSVLRAVFTSLAIIFSFIGIGYAFGSTHYDW